MRILIDADACPVVKIAERVAREKRLSLLLYCDTSHILRSDYGTVVLIGQGADAVDFALTKEARAGDVVITQDYGVAAMVLGKGAAAIHQSGKWYTNENIDLLLMERHMAKKARRTSKKHHLKGPSKREEEDDLRFEESFRKLIEHELKRTGGVR